MDRLRSIAFLLVFYTVTLLGAAFALLSILGGPRTVRVVARWWSNWHRWCAATLLGVRTRIEGELPPGPVLIAGKHQSMFETMELVRLFEAPAIIMKQELAKIPIWGRLAHHYGLIAIDRAGGATALRRMVQDARQAISEDRPVVIFPEGTRVLPGESPPLQPGFAGLYRALGVPVVPFALDSGKLWPRSGFVKRPGIVTIRFGAQIPAGLPRREAEAAVHAAINALETRPAAPR
ncbi:MAG TPA: lysophospholipid acyltransferase family protein [Allosphingosinicella sp.]|nr:lysophospholipid acyltransferase family protein [Allosphingosinicella sp.]